MSLQLNNCHNVEKIFGVVGSPIGHSLSPMLHNFGFRKFGLPYIYVKWEIPKEDVAGLIVSARTLKIAGFSVTIPLKEVIIPYLDHLTEDAISVGAVNHIFWDGDKLIGNNTDVYGFMMPIKDEVINSAMILGTGGAALSAICGLLKLGVKKILVAGRNKERLNFIKQRFNIHPIMWNERHNYFADLLVNSTPLGMRGKFEQESPYAEENLANFKIIYDIVYNPLETRLIQQAKKLGLKVIWGISMFVYQGIKQFEVWTNKTLDYREALLVVKKHL